MSEFKCDCGCGKVDMKDELLKKLDELRDLLGEPVTIKSGYRCLKANIECGGKTDSAHLDGYAVDIVIPNSRYRHDILSVIFKHNIFNRIGINRSTIHVDCDPLLPPRVIWHYYS